MAAEIDALFRTLVAREGSDLHMSAARRPMIREHGDMVTLDSPELPSGEVERLLREITPERNRYQLEETNDTDFAYEIPDLARFRVNVFRDRHGVGAVFRVIPTEIVPPEKLGLPKGMVDLCYLSKGLVLVTGPTGSGKSTSLAGMIDLINKTRSDHIITVEDPIEFVHRDKKCLVNQREVHSHTQSFASALRAALREDPDIVLVGEMRDLETIEIAIETAETGHLVFGTLHSNSAAETVERIIESFPSNRQNQIRSMLATSLKGVIAQTLCKRKPKGRAAAFELMIVDQGISSLIRDGKTHQIGSAMQIGGARGNILLNDSLAKLVREGTVDAREAYIKAIDKEDLLRKFDRDGVERPDLDFEKVEQRVVASEESPQAQSPALSPNEAPAPAAGPGTPPPPATTLEIDGVPFECWPLVQADFSVRDAIYVILHVDAMGKFTVIDAGQVDGTAAAVNSADRQASWTQHCPGGNIWVGRYRMSELQYGPADRATAVQAFRDKYKPACGA